MMDYVKFENDMKAFSEKDVFTKTDTKNIQEFTKQLIESTSNYGELKTILKRNNTMQKIWSDLTLQKEFKSILMRYSTRNDFFK